MVKYTIWLDEPTEIFYAAVKNLGGAVQDKDGLFTIRLVDKDREPLKQKECNLPVSNRLGESYVYVSATAEGGLIKTGAITATREFQGIQICYQAAFTDRPLEPSQFGSLFYTVASDRQPNERNYTVTKVVPMDVVQESNQR
jgi:hypothetical protein